MKVAIVTKYFPPIKGGIESHCYNLAKELIKRNVYVEVHTSHLSNFSVFEIIDGIKVFRHKHFWLFLPNKQYDIIHLHNFNIFPHIIILAKIFLNRLFERKATKTFVVLTPHGGYVPWWKGFKSHKRVIKKILHKTLGKFLLNKVVDKIIALTEDEYEQLIKEGISRKKIVIIPNGVEEEAFTYPKTTCSELEKYQPYLLFLGRIDPRKNMEFVIKNLNLIDEILFLIAGPCQDSIYYNYLSNLISKLGLRNRVLFLGEVEKKLKYKLIDCALAVCLISHMETEPIIIKESIVRGTPVIISNKIKLPYTMFKTCRKMIFIVSNDEDFLSAVKSLLERKEIVGRCAEIDEEIENWRWSNITGKIKFVYEGILNEGKY
ncbi:MAG: glycosyltransferase family 4 protein [Nitrososphaeria archaeon]